MCLCMIKNITGNWRRGGSETLLWKILEKVQKLTVGSDIKCSYFTATVNHTQRKGCFAVQPLRDTHKEPVCGKVTLFSLP